MQTECNQDSFEFASLGCRKVTAAFDGGAITSNAGALLLREADRAIGLSRRVAACFKDGRRQDRIEHTAGTPRCHSTQPAKRRGAAYLRRSRMLISPLPDAGGQRN